MRPRTACQTGADVWRQHLTRSRGGAEEKRGENQENVKTESKEAAEKRRAHPRGTLTAEARRNGEECGPPRGFDGPLEIALE